MLDGHQSIFQLQEKESPTHNSSIHKDTCDLSSRSGQRQDWLIRLGISLGLPFMVGGKMAAGLLALTSKGRKGGESCPLILLFVPERKTFLHGSQ